MRCIDLDAPCTSRAGTGDGGRPTRGTCARRSLAVVHVVGVRRACRDRVHGAGTTNPLVRAMGRGIRPRCASPAELTHPAHQALQQLPDHAATADGAGERIHDVLVVGAVVVEFRQRFVRLASRSVRARRFCDAAAVRAASRFRGPDHTEAGGGSAMSPPPAASLSDSGRRIGPRREVEVDQRTDTRNGSRSSFAAQRPVALDGEIAPRQRRVA